jgi:hypothetical protein
MVNGSSAIRRAAQRFGTSSRSTRAANRAVLRLDGVRRGPPGRGREDTSVETPIRATPAPGRTGNSDLMPTAGAAGK